MHSKVAILIVMVLAPCVFGSQAGVEEFTLAGPGLTLTFAVQNGQLSLRQMTYEDNKPLLFRDADGRVPGAAQLGNPLCVILRRGKTESTYGMSDFRILKMTHNDWKLLAYLEHKTLPLYFSMQVEVEGNVATWRGQVFWNGEDPIEVDVFYPMFSRVRFHSPQTDRAVTAQTSGIELKPLGSVNYAKSYLGNLAAPVFLAEGGGRGLAFVDDNRGDYAPDPGAGAQRGQVIGNTFPIRGTRVVGGDQGPFLGIRYTRAFKPISVYGGQAEYDRAEPAAGKGNPLPIIKLGEAVDIGPVKMYAYEGSWKVGAAWARTQRRWVPMRRTPAEWWDSATIMTEGGLPRDGSFRDLAKLFVSRQRVASSDFHFVGGFSASEVLGIQSQSRGDYFFASPQFGGFDDMSLGMRAVHAAGGRMFFYVEGMIMWKRSQVGRAAGKDWALMEPDGSYTEHYKGFWHMCPAVKEYQEWFANMAAEVVRTTGVDGFFIDSSFATYNHRCFNPAHRHPHPDVWNWGLRQLSKRLREELDKVNPNTIVIFEGCGDLGREYADGFLAHSAFWSNNTADVPLVRFLYPEINTFDSWGYDKTVAARNLVFNAVNGYRLFAHGSFFDQLGPQAARIKEYHRLYPEIYKSPISIQDAVCDNCMAQLFEGPELVLTVGNTTDKEIEAGLVLPVRSGVLFDRVTSARVPVQQGKAVLKLSPWEVRAYAVRP